MATTVCLLVVETLLLKPFLGYPLSCTLFDVSHVITPHQIENSWKISKQEDRTTSKICSSLILHFCFTCILSSPLPSDGICCSPLLLFCFSPLPVSSLLHFSASTFLSSLYTLPFSSSALLYFKYSFLSSCCHLFCYSVLSIPFLPLFCYSPLVHIFLNNILSNLLLLFCAPFLRESSLLFSASIFLLFWVPASIFLFCCSFPHARTCKRYSVLQQASLGSAGPFQSLATLVIESQNHKVGDGVYVAQQIPQTRLQPWALKKLHGNVPILTKLHKQRTSFIFQTNCCYTYPTSPELLSPWAPFPSNPTFPVVTTQLGAFRSSLKRKPTTQQQQKKHNPKPTTKHTLWELSKVLWQWITAFWCRNAANCCSSQVSKHWENEPSKRKGEISWL